MREQTVIKTGAAAKEEATSGIKPALTMEDRQGVRKIISASPYG